MWIINQIGRFGIKISNIEASTLIETNNGVRGHYEYKDALLANSLLLDFLYDHGLEVKNGRTRDVICLEFNYGTRSYKKEISHLRKLFHNSRRDFLLKEIKCFENSFKGTSPDVDSYYEDARQKAFIKLEKVKALVKTARQNRSHYRELSKADVRKKIYNEGINVTYRNRDGTEDIVHYKMGYRSAGKAKRGLCMFICDRLYKDTMDFLYMGIKLNPDNPMIVESSAYISLISSAIVDRVKIKPEEILVLKDVDSTFSRDVISVEVNEEGHCVANPLKDYTLKNTMFDGQALIDSSIFPSWGNGYILLRHHFCKMAAFKTNIQQFYKDYLGDNYENAVVMDMFNRPVRLKNVKLITTDSAMKWLKFGVDFDYWAEKVRENDCQFGIVKTAHESKLGEGAQRMSYQMVNSLSMEIMPEVASDSVAYIDALWNNDLVFDEHLERNKNYINDYEVLLELCRANPAFRSSAYFKARMYLVISMYFRDVKSGHVLQNADNLTIVGSPYALLLYGATGKAEDCFKDPTFKTESDAIQCYTERFFPNEYIAAFRSPFNSKNNMGYLHNVDHEYFHKYFDFGKLVIAVNMNSTDFQDRNNGSDQDSDTVYATNQRDIVACAKKCYKDYPTIVNNISQEKSIYKLEPDSYAYIDTNLANQQMNIGESSNLAQLCLTYSYNFADKKYLDYVCILSVIAQIAIDSAKRRFNLSIDDELRYIKKQINIKENGYPLFWQYIRPGFSREKINPTLECPMNYLCSIRFKHGRTATIPMEEFIVDVPVPENVGRTNKKIEKLITTFSLQAKDMVRKTDYDDSTDQFLIFEERLGDLIEEIKGLYIGKQYKWLFSDLLKKAFRINDSRNNLVAKNKVQFIKVLYGVNKDLLVECLSKNNL